MTGTQGDGSLALAQEEFGIRDDCVWVPAQCVAPDQEIVSSLRPWMCPACFPVYPQLLVGI